MRDRLIEAREEKGLTEQELAKYLGISVRKYCKIEESARVGNRAVWEKLENLFETPKSILKKNTGVPDWAWNITLGIMLLGVLLNLIGLLMKLQLIPTPVLQ